MGQSEDNWQIRFLLLLALIIIGANVAAWFFLFRVKTPAIPSSLPIVSPTVVPTEALPQKPGWETYKNSELGFEISFPEKYKIQEDKYGWPKAVLLLYGGGQSYDLAIEVWDKKSDYENKYKVQGNLVVKQVGNKYLTLLNMNYKEEVDEIIATFKITD